MRRSVSVALVALAALAAPAAGAQHSPPVPEGTWYLHTNRVTYAGPAGPVRSMLATLMQKRVVFQPLCTMDKCAAMVTIHRPPRGTPVRFTLVQRGTVFVGSKTLTSSLRCNGRPLRATLKLTVATAQRLEDETLTGVSEATAVNPGDCSLFGGKARAVRRAWLHGSR